MWKSSLWMLLPLAVSSRQAQLLFSSSFQVLTSQVGPVSHSPARLPSGLSAWRVIRTMCDLLPLPPPIPSFPPPFIHLCSFFHFFIYIFWTYAFPFLSSVYITPTFTLIPLPHSQNIQKLLRFKPDNSSAWRRGGEPMTQEAVFKW